MYYTVSQGSPYHVLQGKFWDYVEMGLQFCVLSFISGDYLSEIVDQAIAINVKTVWAQLGVANEQAAKKALDAGLNVIMDACIKVEYLRLGIRTL